jgi:hypothetical protein
MNIGEEITAAYLRAVKGCEFTQHNLQTVGAQGEIDVIGLNLKKKRLYVCEVAIHLTSGLRYVKNKRPNTAPKLIEKFSRDIEYAQKYYPKFQKHYMIWSPVVKSARAASKENQVRSITEIQQAIRNKYSVEIEAIINKRFSQCLDELRKHAAKTREELKSPVLRYLQIEEYLKAHIKRGRV